MIVRPGKCAGHRRSLSLSSIKVLSLSYDQYALINAGYAPRIILWSFNDDRAGQAHQHLRLHFAMHMGVIPIEALRHVRRDVEMVGKGAPATALWPHRRIGADAQHIILRTYGWDGESMHMKIGRPRCLVFHAWDDGK